MPCEIRKRLTQRFEDAHNEVLQWNSKQNASFYGAASERRRKSLLKDALAKETEASNEHFRHEKFCEECKQDRAGNAG
jgi:hypothetical protein